MGEFNVNLTVPGTSQRPVAPVGVAAVAAVADQAPVRATQAREERVVDSETPARAEAESRSVAEAAEAINRTLAESQRELRFSVDEGSGRTLVFVMHPETGEVVRQIPSEVVLAMAEMLDRGERLSSLGLELRT